MKEWDEMSEDVSRIRPDKEKAKSLLQLIALREKNISTMNPDEFSTLVAEGYYEIVKELITAIMSTEGWKTVSHELLIGYMANFYSSNFSQAEIYVMDQLRKTRNDIAYKGIIVRSDYLKRNKDSILQIIDKLKKLVQEKVKR